MADDKARASRETLEKVELDEEVEDSAGNGWAALLLGFLGTPAGQALNEKVADWVGSHNDGNRAEQKRESAGLHWRFGLMAFVIVLAVGLRAFDKLDSTIVGLLGLALGYLFGRQQSAE
jgi:hypothetical protein